MVSESRPQTEFPNEAVASSRAVASSQEPSSATPFAYWSWIAIQLSTQRDKCRIYVFESIFGGAAVLFLYFIAVSPPSRPFNIADGFVTIVVIGCTLLIAFHYVILERKLRHQLERAVDEAASAAERGEKRRRLGTRG